jgi:hypothetical protein
MEQGKKSIQAKKLSFISFFAANNIPSKYKRKNKNFDWGFIEK